MDIAGRCPVNVLHTQGMLHTRRALVGSKGVSTSVRYASASSSAFASCRSAVSKPSVNQP